MATISYGEPGAPRSHVVSLTIAGASRMSCYSTVNSISGREAVLSMSIN